MSPFLGSRIHTSKKVRNVTVEIVAAILTCPFKNTIDIKYPKLALNTAMVAEVNSAVFKSFVIKSDVTAGPIIIAMTNIEPTASKDDTAVKETNVIKR